MGTFIAIKAQSRIVESVRMDARQVALVLAARLGDDVEDLGGDAKADWPTATGVSQAGLEWGVEVVGGGGVRAFVEDLVWYAGYVRIPAGNAWLHLVVMEAEEDEEELVDDLADAVVVAMLGGM